MPRLAETVEESTAARNISATAPRRTANDIRQIIHELDVVARHFDQDVDEIDPYVVFDSVSVDAFDAYVGRVFVVCPTTY